MHPLSLSHSLTLAFDPLALFLYLSRLPFLLQRFLLRIFCTFFPAIQFMHFTDLNFKLTFCAGFISSSNSLFNFVVFVTLLMRHTASFLKEINVSCSFRFEFCIIIISFSLFWLSFVCITSHISFTCVCAASFQCVVTSKSIVSYKAHFLKNSSVHSLRFGCLVLFINFFLILFTFNLIF